MIAKKLTIEIKGLKEVLQDVSKVWKQSMRGEKFTPLQKLSFEDKNTMHHHLTQNRLTLLSLIKRKKPQSIYALAELAKRDFKNVYEDLKTLKELGLVECSTNNKNKKNVVPTLLYSGLNLHFTF